MLGRQIRLFEIFGFTIRIHASWIIIAVLVTWSLAEGVFRGIASLSAQARWIMGVAGAIGLFTSVVFHELCHSLVARRYGLHMRGITLFLFGGVAEMSEEPQSPKVEFWMAIAGPLASLFLGAALIGGVMAVGTHIGVPVSAVVSWLGVINVALAVFNMIPGFPLDGGRVLRSGLWALRRDLAWATRWASRCGSGLGIGLMALGLVESYFGGLLAGIWWVVLGVFLRYAARQGYQQTMVRQALHGQHVGELMNRQPVIVPDDVSLDDLVKRYVYPSHLAMFPVMHDGHLVGAVSTPQLRTIPMEAWAAQTTGQIVQLPSAENSVDPDADAADALAVMSRNEAGSLMVVRDGNLEGVLTMQDLLKFAAIKLQLQTSRPAA